MRTASTLLLLSLAIASCSSSGATTAPPVDTAPTSGGAATAPQAATTPAATTPAATTPGAPPALPGGNVSDAPEISRSVGLRGGVVLFWPRVAPRTEDPAIRALAAAVQQRLRALAERALPGRAIDVRPDPERVCPRQGCEAMTVGASLFHTPNRGCIVVALVSGAGMSPQRLIPWAGDVTLRAAVVPFREPPEGAITARDMSRCERVVDELGQHEADVVAAIREAAPPH